MSDGASPHGQVTTSSGDYGGAYYATHLGGDEEYKWESESWRAFFTQVAARIIAVCPARTVLDVGCAKGMLVQALVAQGVDAYGLDVSEHAIATAHDDVRDRLRVASATVPLTRRYDLITCIEVLEHMSPRDAQDAIDVMCAATDRIVFSSSPTDLAEPTHVNVHDNRQWAGWFAERGFYRRTDADLGFLTPWAVLFERADLTMRDLVARYEDVLTPLISEVLAKREALLASHREVEQQRRLIEEDHELGTVSREEVARWQEEVLKTRHQMLVNRDYIIGVEAELGRVKRDLASARRKLVSMQRRVATLVRRRNVLRKKLAKYERKSQRTAQTVTRQRKRIRQLETELAQARRSWVKRAAGRVRGSMT